MTSQTERMLAGEWYITDEALLDMQRQRQTVMERYNATGVADQLSRRELLLELMGEVGDEVEVRSPVFTEYGSNVRIADGVFINHGCHLCDVATITIGAGTQLGPNVQLLTPVHPVEPDRRRARWETAKPISIGANVWLGGGVVVCPGVTIGDDTVVGAGAVVVDDLPAGVLAVGNPARTIRDLT